MEENLPFKSEEIIQRRKEKILAFIKKDSNTVSYVLLAIITFIAVRIRTANLARLRDITTGTWTLGPDLDPFLFLRWAKYIVENGKLMAVDTMRYVPLGYDTSYELNLHVYFITWFHQIVTIFGSSSITQSAVLYPVFMFGLSVIAFFFMTRRFCLQSLGEKKANSVALIASFFLAVTPALLPRTIAGIPEKEASGILFLFLAFYLFMVGWEAKGRVLRYTGIVLAGVATALMGLVWGGYLYILITIAPLIFLAFILGKVDIEKKGLYLLWFVTTITIMIVSTNRYSLSELLTSTTTIPLTFLVVIFVLDSILFSKQIDPYLKKTFLAKIPRPLVSILIALVLGVVFAAVMFGPGFISHNILQIKKFLVTTGTDRLTVTVAENKQPYFTEWVQSFGPTIRTVPLVFWLFFIGAISACYNALKSFNKQERLITTSAFVLFLVSLIFSRYAPSSTFNGTNALSLLVYALGPLILLIVAGKYYRKYSLLGEEERLKNIDFGLMFVLCFFIISLLSARGGIRLVMMLVPAASILAAYTTVEAVSGALRARQNASQKYLMFAFAAIAVIAIIFSGFAFYRDSLGTARGYVPGIYNQQWQKAMAWTRENTPQSAVFGHWWDYGYWIQSIGERATVLDGGNAKSYWNHLMGRYALTGTSNKDALEFLYAHNTTHFLIDPTDIGKYGAFASIGSDKNYDRTSYITVFNQDPSQLQEKKNSSIFVYMGGFSLDEDILFEVNGTQIFLPANKAGLGAILVERSSNEGKILAQPEGIFVYEGRQYRLPLRYAFDSEFKDFGTGVEAGVFFMPRLIDSGGNGLEVVPQGSLLYLSKRTVKSQFARLYLYNENNANFKLVHSEDDFLIAQLKGQVPGFTSDFVTYDTVRGPIRIWEIHYPRDIAFKPEYIREDWPPELLRV